nr:hypothetical protein [Cylindrospermopsis raciborskii]
MLRNRPSTHSEFSLEKEPEDNHQERSPVRGVMRSPFNTFRIFP